MKRTIIAALLMATACGVSAQKYYEKHLSFPTNASLEQKVEMAARLVPTQRQLEWQQMELTAFLHFGINTFTEREWGNGTEDPSLFNPTDLDCDQWVKALKDAGFKMAIITAKHHDGFCLWPTVTTEHSVAFSSWKGGKGDVVKELREACRKYGLKFGVYLSPWDRNAKCYGDSPAYNKFFLQQLTELLTNYGEVHEVWFDGANGEGPNGKKQVYEWTPVLETIHRLQPNAVTAIMGDDVRWVGNESGLGRETEWSPIVKAPGSYPGAEEINKPLPSMGKDLGSRKMLQYATDLFWYPSEVDVSIRPGWFYHADQDSQVKSLAKLIDIYFQSVGYNSSLLLNIPPDKNGKINQVDVTRIKELYDYITATFSDNKVLKGNSVWTATKGSAKIYNLKKDALVNTFMIQEDISKGQRMESYTIEALYNGKWHFVAEGTTIGYKRLFRTSDRKADKLRITVKSSRSTSYITNVGAYYAMPLKDNDAQMKLSDLSPKDWKVINDSEAASAIDGNDKTYWKADALKPLTVDMGKVEKIGGFSYAPVSGDDLTGTIYQYKFYISSDAVHWTECDTPGEFSNIMHNPVPCMVRFGKSYEARYFKLVPLTEINGRAATSIAEIGILK